MLRAALACLLVLAGCPEYEITADTTVTADGKVRRALVIDGDSEWKGFRRPEGYVDGVREFPFGTHASGIARKVGETSLAPVEGTFSVDVEDLVLGKLYRYRERVSIGEDPAHFRRELGRWLDFALDVVLKGLREEFPDLDFSACGKHARATLLPRLERSIGVVHAGAVALVGDPDDRDEEKLAASFEKLVVGELARDGFFMLGGDLDNQVEAYVEGKLLDEFLAPLGEAAKGEEFKERVLSIDWDGAAEGAYPGGKEKLKDEFARFVVSATGAYAIAIFSSHDFRFSVRMPGRVLRANGGLGRLPEVRWHLDNKDLIGVSPVLTAASFAPAEGIPDGTWSPSMFADLREALAALNDEQRAKLEEMVAKGPQTLREAPGDPALVPAIEAMAKVLEEARAG